MESAEQSETTIFKALLRENSVNKYYVELKESIFTEKGFLDLVKAPSLRVIGAGQFIKDLRKKNRLRLKDVAKIAGVTQSTINSWEHNRNRIPLHTLVKIAENVGITRDTVYSLMDQGQFYLKTKVPVRFENIRHIVRFFTPYKLNSEAVNLNLCSMEMLSQIKEILNVNPKFRPKRQERTIYSTELHSYLTTFFRYTKVSKLHPPLTDDVKDWYYDNVDLKSAIIIPSLQSDGGIKKYNNNKKIYFCGNNKVLHDLFVDAVHFEYNKLPTSYFIRCPSEYITLYEKRSMNEIANEIMNLAGNTKTKPAHGQTVEEYLQEPQPHLNYLINAPKREQRIALRIWASAEGCIFIYKNKKGGVYPRLEIACAHPNIATKLQHIAKQHGINFNLKHDKRKWSGIDRLSNGSICGCISFLKLGGFVKGVKIGNTSPYHKGIAKDILTLGILEYIRQRKMNKWPKKLPIDIHHLNVNQIIKNREYKSMNYYLDYFS